MLGVALAAVFYAAGYFTGRSASGDVLVTVENKSYTASAAENAGEGLVDLNSADRWQLMSLPGIGETLADRIIEYRSAHGAFTCPEELMSVSGIGEALFDKIAGSVTVGNITEE